MHVALCSPAWPPAQHPNGIVTYVHCMRHELRRQGHRVSVFTGVLDRAEEGVYLVRPRIAFRMRCWMKLRLGDTASYVLGWGQMYAAVVRSVHREHPIDVLEMEESFGWAADIARLTGVPTVIKLHGPAFMSLVEGELALPFSERRIVKEGEALRQMPVLTSPARHTLNETMARYALAPRVSRHIVNPVALPPSAPVWKRELCDPRTLLFVGRFDQRKGGDIVLHAFAQLLLKFPDMVLIFVGPDSGIPAQDGRKVHFNELRAALFPGTVSTQVKYLGKLQPDEVYALRAKAQITLIASRWENQSYTALEAMLQGCPVVSSDTGGQSEIIIDGVTGLLAASGSSADLCAKIELLLREPERAAALGRRAREYVLEQHAPVRVVRETLGVYEEAIGLTS